MNNSKLNHKNIEKVILTILGSALVIFILYYIVYKIDWVKIYSESDGNSAKSISALSESCIKCHGDVKGFSRFHDPSKIGCASCHLGNKNSNDKNIAHSEMVLIPGNSIDAKKTCGKTNCHPGIPERIDSSLMSTMSGIISVDKFAFEEINAPNGKFHIKKIGNSASESHLRNLCASCHLGAEKTEFGPITELSRGGGCNACHLNYSEEAKAELDIYVILKNNQPDSALLKFHPSLSLKISNDHCFGCHSRSGRISTSYEGWHETSLIKDEINDRENFRLLEDGRVFKKIKPDVHFEAGLVCVDCHISYEVMGDGKFYEHKEQQIFVKCTDCHSSEKQESIILDEFDFESKKIAEIYGIDDDNRKFIKVQKSNTPLINTFFERTRKPKLIGKISNKIYDLKSPKFECIATDIHSDLSCNSCHTAWAPQCIGCHTQFEQETEGFDLLQNRETDSSWVEYHGDFFAELPTLGVREEIHSGSIKRIIDTFIPGMIMTLDKKNFTSFPDSIIFKRLFAPSVAHTIRKESRSCESCHNNPLALGYGRGKLKFVVNKKIGRWLFEPLYEKVKYDDLPEDAWIGFLSTRNKDMATRENVRPFNIEEQQKILNFGACLTCHSSESEIICDAIHNYRKQLDNLSTECILPSWE